MRSSHRILSAAIAAALLIPLGACASAGTRQAARPDLAVAPQPAGAPSAESAAPSKAAGTMTNEPAGNAPLADRMVIRNANVRLEVPKVLDAVGKVRALTARFGGVVSNLQLASDTGDGISPPQPLPGAPERIVRTGLPYNASLTILVPAAKFDAFRKEAESLGRVLSENSADEDVTQQHVDLKARLENAKAEESRLRTFFSQAKSVTDMLSIERELTRVRGDIESMTAQLASLERQAAMATLTIELVEPKPIVRPTSGIDWGFGDALTEGIQAMVGLLKAALVVVIATSPLWLAALALFFILRWRLRVRRARAAASAEVPQTPPA